MIDDKKAPAPVTPEALSIPPIVDILAQHPTLPQGLNPLRSYRQWVAWRLTAREGKQIKLPVDPLSGKAISTSDPTQWRGYDEVATLISVSGQSLGIGFVFTADDPFFFVDVDKCREPSGLFNDTAQQIMKTLHGCYFEVSQSGTGIHLIGSGEKPVDSGCKSSQHGLEIYDRQRFVALTFRNASGSAQKMRQNELEALCSQYLGQTAQVQDVELSDQPDPAWNGPDDDEELIAKALSSQSAGASLGLQKATFRQLWEADHQALETHYPKPDGSFDHSSADAALLQHLAFWTGKNAARMDRLFRQSALNREKWESRPDYRQRSIRLAVGLCRNVFRQSPSSRNDKAVTQGDNFLPIGAQIQRFAGCVYVSSVHRILTPKGRLLDSNQFNSWYGGAVFTWGDSTTKEAFKAFTQSQEYAFPKVDQLCFRPDQPPLAVIDLPGGLTAVNRYVPVDTPQSHADPAPFLEHVAKLLPDSQDQAILLAWMASLVQNPGVKFQWAPLLIGVPGNGKTLLAKILKHAIGEQYCHDVDPGDIANKFNAWIEGNLFCTIEEVHTAGKRELLDALKPLITNDRLAIQAKGQDQRTGDNRANFYLTSNHKDAIPKTEEDRRYAVFFTGQMTHGDLQRFGMTGDYFPTLYQWLISDGFPAVNGYLRRYPVPAALDPARDCIRAPRTSQHQQILSESQSGIAGDILQAAREDEPGFQKGLFIPFVAWRYLAVGNKPRLKAKVLEDAGYIPHPALCGGRSRFPGLPQPTYIFVKKGHPSAAADFATLKIWVEQQTVGQVMPPTAITEL